MGESPSGRHPNRLGLGWVKQRVFCARKGCWRAPAGGSVFREHKRVSFGERRGLPTLRTTLEEFQPSGLADKQKELADAIANARKLKIDPDSLEVVQQLKAELAEGGDLDRLENQVYSDLHTFFSRYYSSCG